MTRHPTVAVDSIRTNDGRARRITPLLFRAVGYGLPFALALGASLVPRWAAADGVLEINQACAVNTGCFAGDAAGFPVTIDGGVGRSYRLSSDLVVPDHDTSAIVVNADHVNIDLAGFGIKGPVVCGGTPLACTPGTGTGSGVDSTTSWSGVTVRNGSIWGMGASGVRLLGPQSEATSLRVRSNALSGIRVGHGSTVSSSSAYHNGAAGISVGDGSMVTHNAVYANGEDGIVANFGSTVSGNTVYLNESDGIDTFAGCTVTSNTVRSNGRFGLNLDPDCGYRDNVISSNVFGQVVGTTGSVDLGGNACNGSATCP